MNADARRSLDSLTGRVINAVFEGSNAARLTVCLLINFNDAKVDWKRVVFQS